VSDRLTEADQRRGIYRKYHIERTDGSSGPGGKHERCLYFVLDLEHDPFALPALRAYAKACKRTHPALAGDIARILAAVLSPNDTARALMVGK
jgi:hypothetical protein